MSFLLSSIYHGIGADEFDIFETEGYNKQVIFNWLGYVFYSSID